MVEPWEKFYEAIWKLKSSDSSEVTEQGPLQTQLTLFKPTHLP